MTNSSGVAVSLSSAYQYRPGRASREAPDSNRAVSLDISDFKLAYSGKHTGAAEIALINAGWSAADSADTEVLRSALKNQAKFTRLAEMQSGVDQRIQAFLERMMLGVSLPEDVSLKLPSFGKQLVCAEPGVARTLSLPKGEKEYLTPHIKSYALGEDGEQGILNNPASSARTTEGTFHIVEAGQAVPKGKKALPKDAAARLLSYVLNDLPERQSDLMEVPYTANSENPLHSWVSLNLRPGVLPELPGLSRERRSDVSVMVPGRFVSNIDFLEEVFQNAGDPFDLANDAVLDPHWTGTSHKIIFAPDIHKFLTKKDLGLPSKTELEQQIAEDGADSDASKLAQRRIDDGMFWESGEELYNDGNAFKLVFRDASGNSITVITDNYFGYGKKTCKSEALSLVANVLGLAEEEHAGGTIAHAREDIGRSFSFETHLRNQREKINFSEVKSLLGERLEDSENLHYAKDKYLNVIYLDDEAQISANQGKISWTDGTSLDLDSKVTYMLGSGVQINFEKEPKTDLWRLVATSPEGIYLHKPCTVSGGGKSELSKMLFDAMSVTYYTVNNLDEALSAVEKIVDRDYADRYTEEYRNSRDWSLHSRPLLDPSRSLGSVIKLLTKSDDYSPEYNAWLDSISPEIKRLVFLLKRRWRPEMGSEWKKHFSVDHCDGAATRALKFRESLSNGTEPARIKERELRVGLRKDGSARKFTLRPDFMPAKKFQMEDDITLSGVVSGEALLSGLSKSQVEAFQKSGGKLSFKLAGNAEYFLFQRPDGAKNRGEDRKAEADFASGNGFFFSNFEPLTRDDAIAMVRMPEIFDKFTEPMQKLIKAYAEGDSSKKLYFVSSDQARFERDAQGNIKTVIKGGLPKPLRSANPRYLEPTQAVISQDPAEIMDVSRHLRRQVKVGESLFTPVDAVVSGQRFSPSEEKPGGVHTKPLLTNNPLHYMPLPEFLMSTIPSLTPKSVSTTGGAGVEGALTKGPFNSLPEIYDIEAAVVSAILTHTDHFVSAAGNIGPNYDVGHDVSLLIPEIWATLSPEERSAEWLIENGYLEEIKACRQDGTQIENTEILGYRSTHKFWLHMGGRVFNTPDVIFPEDMLKPEIQNPGIFEDSLENVREAQREYAKRFFEDGTIELASEPVKALLHIMRDGYYQSSEDAEKLDLHSAEFRKMFTYEYLLESDSYWERINCQQEREINTWTERRDAISDFIEKHGQHHLSKENLAVAKARLAEVEELLARARSNDFRQLLVGTIGLHPNMLNPKEGYQNVA